MRATQREGAFSGALPGGHQRNPYAMGAETMKIYIRYLTATHREAEEYAGVAEAVGAFRARPQWYLDRGAQIVESEADDPRDDGDYVQVCPETGQLYEEFWGHP